MRAARVTEQTRNLRPRSARRLWFWNILHINLQLFAITGSRRLRNSQSPHWPIAALESVANKIMLFRNFVFSSVVYTPQSKTTHLIINSSIRRKIIRVCSEEADHAHSILNRHNDHAAREQISDRALKLIFDLWKILLVRETQQP